MASTPPSRRAAGRAGRRASPWSRVPLDQAHDEEALCALADLLAPYLEPHEEEAA